MNDLFRSEWRRFRRLALGVAVGHLLLLLVLSRTVEVLELGHEDQAAMLFAYMLGGVTLAVLQVGGYRQPSRWLWLIHRPLEPARIFGALMMAAAAQLAVAVFVPLLLFLVATDVWTTQVVDVRHYVTLFHAWAFALMAWLAGAHAATSRYRAAVAVLLAPVVLALRLASVWWLLVPVLTCLVWLMFIARHSFRANRAASLAQPGVLLLTALPLQLAFFFLLFHGTKSAIALVTLVSSGPGRTVLSTDAAVDVEAMMRSIGTAFFVKGLANSNHPRAAEWREQLPLLPSAELQPDIVRFPVRHQLGNVARPWWDDARNIKWTFGHDRMQFHGRSPATGVAHGWWGPEGQLRASASSQFDAVPLTATLARTTMFAADPQTQQQHELVRLPAGEWFIGSPMKSLERLFMLTNRRVLAYRADRTSPSADAPPILDWALPFDAAGQPPAQVVVAELLDGWLVSLFYEDAREFDGFESFTSPRQQIMHITADGQATLVGQRRVEDHHTSVAGSVLVPVASWWVSPPLYVLAHATDRLDTGSTFAPRFELVPRVPAFYVLALSLMALSMALAYAWLRASAVSPSRRRLWLVVCALVGMPALLSMLCLEPRGMPVFRGFRIGKLTPSLPVA